MEWTNGHMEPNQAVSAIHTLAEAILGGIKVNKFLLMTNDMVIKRKSSDWGRWNFG